MRTGIDNGIFIVAMGQIGVVFFLPEGKLQNPHTGESCKVAQGGNLICNDAQILRDEGGEESRAFLSAG